MISLFITQLILNTLIVTSTPVHYNSNMKCSPQAHLFESWFPSGSIWFLSLWKFQKCGVFSRCRPPGGRLWGYALLVASLTLSASHPAKLWINGPTSSICHCSPEHSDTQAVLTIIESILDPWTTRNLFCPTLFQLGIITITIKSTNTLPYLLFKLPWFSIFHLF